MVTQNNNLTEVTDVEQAALALVQNDIERAEKSVLPQNTTQVATKRNPSQRSERTAARKARQELYGDKTVPRIRRERRYGGSSHSRAYLKKALCLYSDRAQVFFENNYERVNADLIVSTLVLEAVGGTDFADEISVRIEKEFNTLEKKMMHANAELERVATAKNIAPDQQVPAYDHKRFYEPPLHTPHSAQFMTVVQLFDRIIARAEGCWIHKAMNAQTRNNVVRSWEKKLSDFVRTLHSIRVQAITQARKSGFGQRAAAIEANVRRQQAEEQLEKKDIPTAGANDTPGASTPNSEAQNQDAPQAPTTNIEQGDSQTESQIHSSVEEPNTSSTTTQPI